MEFNEIEEAVLNAISKAEQSGAKGIKQLLQPILDKCVAYRESIGGMAPGVLSKDPLNKPDWADSAFDVASDDDQSKYFSRAYGALEANPELKAMYDKDPQMRLGEELWDIDNKNPNPRYTTLKDFISKHKFNVPVDRYNGKPETEYYKNVLALMGDPNGHFGEEQAEGLDNLLEGLKDTPHDNRW